MHDNDFTLKTERLRLAPVGSEHAAGLFALMRDPRISRHLAWAPHATENETAALIEVLVQAQKRGAGYHWTILANDEIVGLISLIDVQRSHRLWRLDRAEIAYWIGTEKQGVGFATEATGSIISFAFDRLGLNRLKISHTSANPASGAIPRKFGFRFIGTERQFFEKNGVWYDMNHYEMLADDWAERRRQTTMNPLTNIPNQSSRNDANEKSSNQGS